MDKATEIVCEIVIDTLGSVIYDEHPHHTPDDVQNWVQQMCEEEDESLELFDEDYYQLFYLDKKSKCINWQLIAETLEKHYDEIYSH